METFSYIHQRRAMPNIMVDNIIGFSPMTAPSLNIFQLKARRQRRLELYKPAVSPELYKLAVSPELYNHFLRLNNRRKTLSDKHFITANYYCQTTRLKNYEAAKTWCIDQFGLHGFWANPLTNRFWFVTQEDAVQFVLAWNEC